MLAKVSLGTVVALPGLLHTRLSKILNGMSVQAPVAAVLLPLCHALVYELVTLALSMHSPQDP